jgi:hypothetical protein
MNKFWVSSVFAAAATCGLIAWASTPIGVTPTLIARGTYPAFKVDADKHAYPIDFRAHAKYPLDVVVRQHDYAPDSTTGWHSHPGPAFITVLEGELTFYEYDDPECRAVIVSAGQGYVDSGHGHIGFNRGTQPAKDVTVVMAPVGLPFRAELDAPGPHCGGQF